MRASLEVHPFDGTLATRLEQRSKAGRISESWPLSLYWLGQAGFVVDSRYGRFVVDPYLSDSLAHKYRGTHFPHTRMMPPPIEPVALTEVDYVLCTHRHTDHMDPDTLRPMAGAQHGVRFVVPEASSAEAQKRCGVTPDRLVLADHGRTLTLPLPAPDAHARVHALASAHEVLQIDAQGHNEWLGYVLEVDGLRIYHSGDCIPYPGLGSCLRAWKIDLALLPVNGRDMERLGNGVPGNFTLEEAVELAAEAGIPHLLAHHYGLFEFSTIAPELIDAQIPAAAAKGVHLVRARTACCFMLTSNASF